MDPWDTTSSTTRILTGPNVATAALRSTRRCPIWAAPMAPAVIATIAMTRCAPTGIAMSEPMGESTKNTIAIMLQNHIARYGPLPDELGDTARAALGGDWDAIVPLAHALATIEDRNQDAPEWTI